MLNICAFHRLYMQYIVILKNCSHISSPKFNQLNLQCKVLVKQL